MLEACSWDERGGGCCSSADDEPLLEGVREEERRCRPFLFPIEWYWLPGRGETARGKLLNKVLLTQIAHFTFLLHATGNTFQEVLGLTLSKPRALYAQSLHKSNKNLYMAIIHVIHLIQGDAHGNQRVKCQLCRLVV